MPFFKDEKEAIDKSLSKWMNPLTFFTLKSRIVYIQIIYGDLLKPIPYYDTKITSSFQTSRHKTR